MVYTFPPYMFALVMVAAVTRAFFLPVLHDCLLIFAVTPGASGPGNPVDAVSCHRPASTHGTQKWDFRVRIMLTISFQRVHRCPDKFFDAHLAPSSLGNIPTRKSPDLRTSSVPLKTPPTRSAGLTRSLRLSCCHSPWCHAVADRFIYHK